MNDTMGILLGKIRSLQSAGDKYFPAGIFPAHRSNPIIWYRRPDTTIFFSAIISFTLSCVRKYVSSDQQAVIDAICSEVAGNYPDFRNKDGLDTYNFWKTKPSRHFPNGYIFRHFEHFRIPDDVDDTAFIYLTSPRGKEEVAWLKNKLSLHANGEKQWIKNTFPQVRKLRAYSTWFGKHMYIEFDACVLSNILYCIYQHGTELNENDRDSLEYIRFIIEEGHYLRVPFRCAHQYPRSELIIYHVARLIAAFDPVPLRSIRSRLIADTRLLLNRTEVPMDRVILSSSLLRLGVQMDYIEVEKFTSRDFKGFYFFIAGLLTAYEHPVLYRIANSRLFHMYWTCEAHCLTLLAEYVILHKLRDKHADKPLLT
ncbi:hypothetical protein DYBT9275_03429 [Dyadobacter sp. CECT 9275]|uniref:Uncharacterized protein n=1 Tax=Dyadobacter helix TaxID=2822344 RepID=A0A916N6P6_9BACT|nr:hypothetical protein [Dyadobacter sp. CECT 9275]CAG5004710.1 hypothetical protein DYBT9275_03429 [Dyadobacter sp. CECT 9275]